MKKGAVLLVEDEVMIRMMVADMLEELGYSVAAQAGTVPSAVKLAQTTDFDFAVLDVNLAGSDIGPVADAIAVLNRPFIFATGYGLEGLPPKHRDRPFLNKPFSMENLAEKISGIN